MWPSRRPSWCSGWRSMAAVRAEVLELVFAGAVLAVFGSAVAALYGRVSRQAPTLLAAIVAPAAAVAWVVFALEPTAELALAAGGLTVCAAFQLLVLRLGRVGRCGRQGGRGAGR